MVKGCMSVEPERRKACASEDIQEKLGLGLFLHPLAIMCPIRLVSVKSASIRQYFTRLPMEILTFLEILTLHHKIILWRFCMCFTAKGVLYIELAGALQIFCLILQTENYRDIQIIQ